MIAACASVCVDQQRGHRQRLLQHELALVATIESSRRARAASLHLRHSLHSESSRNTGTDAAARSIPVSMSATAETPFECRTQVAQVFVR